jgi:hypothetical protein
MDPSGRDNVSRFARIVKGSGRAENAAAQRVVRFDRFNLFKNIERKKRRLLPRFRSSSRARGDL